MPIAIPFDNTYARLPQHLFAQLPPQPARAPKLIAFNAPLAAALGIAHSDDAVELAETFGGNRLPERAEPLAQLYGGHQFGYWSGQLGDGRALLLGEVSTGTGRYDIQLKGAGRTPYSRSGDGLAWLGPVLREYIISEAMHALGIPSSRALAAVATGAPVYRQTTLPGAVLTRVAASHIRVGSFQILAARGDRAGLQALFEYAAARHYPDAADPTHFLQHVIDAQVALVAKWMGVGFIHGVMNTDNCAISGETLDYGPCAFMDAYHAGKVFSSIDHHGRYAYGNQPKILVWNMAQLATALVPLMPDQDQAIADFTARVHAMPAQIARAWRTTFGRKLGFADARKGDEELINALLELMQAQQADFTNTFRGLLEGTAQEQFQAPQEFEAWHRRWRDRLRHESDATASAEILRAANPALIPRNHQIETMITAALNNDYGPFWRLNGALAQPFEDVPEQNQDLTRAPLESERVQQTFCGT
ncbi:MAG: YdiU family protein [Rhodobacteraceae bacterium]|nr:YdiU family protein [Paracoccaceae bacterium]